MNNTSNLTGHKCLVDDQMNKFYILATFLAHSFVLSNARFISYAAIRCIVAIHFHNLASINLLLLIFYTISFKIRTDR
uniref:Ovule protein n=1 Tax=Heterorhabditis bacteriophora TaxID=37862 RepID=A0A1I7WG61_HETBA